ncbi:ion transporter [bacterium B17]|nr:ion transporter [bacterium B17]
MEPVSDNVSAVDWRVKARKIIFDADTPAGKAYDIILILTILLSVLVVMLDSVESFKVFHGTSLYVFEWIFTFLFTIDYVVRLVCVSDRIKYATSFFGVVDLLSVVPTYLCIFDPRSRFLVTIRFLRVLRVFRVLKLAAYLDEVQVLTSALRASMRKIAVFVLAVLSLVVVLGSLMYVIEGAEHGFTSIPRSIYWAIVTLTTVGYGDISPMTALGQTLAATIMILGYSIIAVPTGVVSVEISRAVKKREKQALCKNCGIAGHDEDASYCKHCGSKVEGE